LNRKSPPQFGLQQAPGLGPFLFLGETRPNYKGAKSEFLARQGVVFHFQNDFAWHQNSPNKANNIAVMTSEITSDPKQPVLLEKKKNIE
jgi:hypothetical protein